MRDYEVAFLAFVSDNGFETVVKLGKEFPNECTFNYGGDNEEGYYYVQVAFVLEDSIIRMTKNTCSRSCDGRFDTEWIGEVEAERHTRPNCLQFSHPQFVRTESSQRDYYAESMGY